MQYDAESRETKMHEVANLKNLNERLLQLVHVDTEWQRQNPGLSRKSSYAFLVRNEKGEYEHRVILSMALKLCIS